MENNRKELNTMRNEREHEISNNLNEIQKIENNYVMSIQSKDVELDRLTQNVDYLNTEISEKNVELESLIEEN